MGRRPTVHRNLPPGMRARPRGRKVFYYLDVGGKEIPLGSDYPLAMRRYAECVQNLQPVHRATFNALVERYQREVIPTKAPRTQQGNAFEIVPLLKFFDNAPLDEIKPLHIAQYRDWRVTQIRERLLKLNRSITSDSGYVRANRELALFSHIWNKGREWGYTDRPNPGVKKHKERGREVYIDHALYQAVWERLATTRCNGFSLANRSETFGCAETL